MPETTINKILEKRTRTFTSSIKEDSTDTLLYPTNKLYSKEEFELLDSIYSDKPFNMDIELTETDKESINLQRDNFWARNREELLALQNNKTSVLSNLVWFASGMMLMSVVGLIYLQMNGKEIKQKQEIQIVFQKSAQIMTDKTADKEVSEKLVSTEIAKSSSAEKAATSGFKFELPKLALFSLPKTEQKAEAQQPAKEVIASEPKPIEVPVQQQIAEPVVNQVKYHTIGNGDSLWILANKYYSNPSQENIKKIMRANHIRSVYSTLHLGQKLVIPL